MYTLYFASFNSTLVQLKDQINNEFNASEACFNSTLVQLKEHCLL